MLFRLHLLGSPEIEQERTSVALPFDRRHQLLAFLAYKRGWVGRAELAAMLWPQLSTKLAYANLRKTLFRLQSLPWTRGIELQEGAVRFDAATDVIDFNRALGEQRWLDALRLRRGDLLAGFDDGQSDAWTSWLDFERERLRVAWRGAALNRMAGDIDPGEGIELSAQLLNADPLDEAALRANMAWLARSGQAAQARQTYRDFAARLAQDLGIGPGSDLKALHDSLAVAVAAPRARETVETPPAIDDGFIGRSVELRQIAERLARDDCRVLSLIGPGGVGKTRLARRVLRELAPQYASGTVFVPLEDVASAGELSVRVARELGVGLTRTGEPVEQLIEFLRERQMLLVLDNFEHLSASAAVLDRILESCSGIKIIVTSRVRLGLAVEWLQPLEGLPCPEWEDRDRIEAFDSVRVFTRAAQRIEPALNPAADAASIVEICRLVEGLPLALELAAGWTRLLSVAAIAEELRRGTELLRAVDADRPNRPARHASLEVVFEQSWQLLSASERNALSRLAIFRGGFSSEAARTVARASLPVLSSLADQSLLRRDADRIFLHPLVQQFAAARLGEGETRAATDAAHGHYFHRLLAQLRGAIESGDREALQQVDIEFENCRMAWRWAVTTRAADLIAKSASTLLRFCDHRGRFSDGLTLLSEAINAAVSPSDPHLEALLLGAQAHLAYRLDRYAVAEATAARALTAARLARDHDLQVLSLNVLGSCYLSLGRHHDALRSFQQALRQARASADPRNAAAMLDNQALVEKALGQYDEALRLSTESLAHYRRLSDSAGEALCLNNLGALQLDTKDYPSAGEHLRAALLLCDRYGLASTRGLVLTNLTELGLKTEDYPAAESYARRALEFAEAGGHRYLMSWVRLQFVPLALHRGDLAAARADLGAAMRSAIALDRPSLQLAGVSCFADVLAAQADRDCACLVLRFMATHPSLADPERDSIRLRLEQWQSDENKTLRWPAIELAGLVHRIVLEANISYYSLIALLRSRTGEAAQLSR